MIVPHKATRNVWSQGEVSSTLSFVLRCLVQADSHLRSHTVGFPGVSVVKNPPASAGDMGLISDLGRPHMLPSN